MAGTWEETVQMFGPEIARMMYQKKGWGIPNDPAGSPLDPSLAKKPSLSVGGPDEEVEVDEEVDPADGTADTSLTVEGSPSPTGGLAVAPDDPLSLVALQKQIIAQQGRAEEMRQQRYEAAQQMLAQQRLGPSLTERLYALSGVLAAPKSMPGIGGLMAKLGPHLAKEKEAERTAGNEQTKALYELQSKYGEDTEAAAGTALTNQLALARLQSSINAKKKAKAQINPVTGEINEVPGEIHHPTTQQEFDALDFGDYYVVPGGPDKGKIVQKLPPKAKG